MLWKQIIKECGLIEKNKQKTFPSSAHFDQTVRVKQQQKENNRKTVVVVASCKPVIKAATCSSSTHNVGFIWPATNWTSTVVVRQKMLQLCNHMQCCLNDVLGGWPRVVSTGSAFSHPAIVVSTVSVAAGSQPHKMSATRVRTGHFFRSTELENVLQLPSNCATSSYAQLWAISLFQCADRHQPDHEKCAPMVPVLELAGPKQWQSWLVVTVAVTSWWPLHGTCALCKESSGPDNIPRCYLTSHRYR